MNNSEQAIANTQARVLHDAWLEANKAYWERRALAFENARPRKGDYHGQATPQEHQERWARLTATARACRQRGQFADASTRELLETLGCVGADPQRAATDWEAAS
jgi:hypothetical protein